MKIGFLTHNLRQDNGAGVFSLRLITGVKNELGCEVVILTSVPSGHKDEHAVIYPSKWKILFAPIKARKLLKGCDILHALDAFPYGFIAALVALGTNKKIIITAQGSGSVLPLYRWYAPMARFALRRARAITAISNFTKQEILKRAPGLAITVINHGIEREWIERASHATPPKNARYEPYILSVGTIRWRKGYDISIRAFARVVRQFPDLHYVIVGKKHKKDYYAELRRLIDELHLRDRVHILEHIETKEQLADIYKYAELFCLFSQNYGHDIEGFGMVFLEAAAAGIPVVGVKNCGVEDAIQDGKNGFLVSPRNYDDPDAFAEAIIKILNNEDLKKSMGAQSLAFAKECAWEKRIEEYIDIYHSIMRV